ncbi:MAG: alpha/beta hydrolase [Candidatus Sumerlaeia bacterium]|nr:alpha/beta hydrolase [Candidatus Sumerlaeia bacterium]
MKSSLLKTLALTVLLAGSSLADSAQPFKPEIPVKENVPTRTLHKTIKVDGLDIFYREAGNPENPTVLLLHGFPTSSHMFRNLIPQLATRYHVVAPDYPGYGQSSMPSATEFSYTFDNLADVVEEFTEKLDLDTYTIYVMDYGAPVGYRLALRNPKKIDSIVVQNGNAYEEGLKEFWDPIKAYWANRTPETEKPLAGFLVADVTKWQYIHGTRNPENISPDNWINDQVGLDRPGNNQIQLDLFYDYRTNLELYPKLQAYFRKNQPPTLIVWGRNDYIFPADGAYPYLRDLPNAELHLLNTGHFALEEDAELIGTLMLDFLDRRVERED